MGNTCCFKRPVQKRTYVRSLATIQEEEAEYERIYDEYFRKQRSQNRVF